MLQALNPDKWWQKEPDRLKIDRFYHTARLKYLMISPRSCPALLAILLCAACGGGVKNSPPDAALAMISSSMDIVYRVVENRGAGGCLPDIDQPCHRVALTLSLPAPLADANWQVYFSMVDPILKVLPGEFDIEQINGNLHRITPNGRFRPFAAGVPKKIEFIGAGLSLVEGRIMPNYYVATADGNARNIIATALATDAETGLEALPHVAPIDWRQGFVRAASDRTQLATAGYLYRRHRDTRELKDDLALAIIPTPRALRPGPGAALDMTAGVRIEAADFPAAGLNVALARLADLGVAQNDSGIALRIGRDRAMAAESYRLEVTGSKIELRAGDAAGAFYGLISLAALIDPRSLSLPRLTLNDGPRFAFRGMHIDVARNFRSRRFILALLDQMANYKLNKLHLHLADDEGWRLAIAGLPELTAIGARRCHDLEENRCLLPQLGSGATSEAGRDGFYSAEDYQAILRAATARHIQVIPSFDMPGHSRAAVKAMEARFRRLTAGGRAAEAERYLLTDPDDQTRYRSIQHYNDNTINVCMPSSYHFVGKVIDEVKRLHDRAGHPLTRYHIGADETAGAWLESPRCKAFIAAEKRLTDAGQLAGYFIERVAAMLDERGIEPAAWSDGMAHPAIETLPVTVQTNSWETLYGGGQRTPHTQLNRGWQVVLSTPDALYYDFPYQADPKEPGYNWAARHIDTRKVFEFMPENLPVHAEFWFDNQDRPFAFDDRLLRDETGAVIHAPIEPGRRYHGIQGQLWGETVRSDRQAEYKIFPRLLALAERAWHRADWEAPYDHSGALYNRHSGRFDVQKRGRRAAHWNRFANRVGQWELARLDRAGIFYRIPTVGAEINKGRLRANIIFPGLPIQYRQGQGGWRDYRGPVSVSGPVEVRALSPDRQRKGRAIPVL